MNWLGNQLDALALAVAPRYGARRIAERKVAELRLRRIKALERLDLERPADRVPRAAHFRSAETGSRLAANWLASGLSMDAILSEELDDLVKRSRQADDSDAYYGGGIGTMTRKVVGCGLRPQWRIREIPGVLSEKAAVDLSREFEYLYKTWAPTAGADNSSHAEVQELIVRHFFVDGNGLQVQTGVSQADRVVPLALEVVDPRRLGTPPQLEGDDSVRLGVQVTETGAPVKYHFRVRAPEDLGLHADEWKPGIEAARVQHLYARKRTGQTLGVPMGHRALDRLKALLDLEEAEMQSANIAACIAAVITTDDGAADVDAKISALTASGDILEDIMAGKIPRIRPGEKIEGFGSNRPASGFEPFARHYLRSISVGLDMPYELLTGDLSRGNYSAQRLALLAVRAVVRWVQFKLIGRVLVPTVRSFADQCVAVGATSLKARRYREHREKFLNVGFVAPGEDWIDPVKEITASLLAINGNLSTHRIEIESRGYDRDEIFEERAEEKRRMKALDILPDPLPGSGPVGPPKNGLDGSRGSDTSNKSAAEDDADEADDEDVDAALAAADVEVPV